MAIVASAILDWMSSNGLQYADDQLLGAMLCDSVRSVAMLDICPQRERERESER